jgi:hypothetical protein
MKWHKIKIMGTRFSFDHFLNHFEKYKTDLLVLETMVSGGAEHEECDNNRVSLWGRKFIELQHFSKFGPKVI